MSNLFDAVAEYPLEVEEVARTRRDRDTSSGFVRTTTTFHLRGGDEEGRGEDVTYDAEDHDALEDAPEDPFDIVGEYGSFAEFSAALDDTDLFPTGGPEREAAEHYRRWAVESAGLDLALRQNDRALSDVLDVDPDPVRFVVSTRLGDPPSRTRIESILSDYPDTEFKLDPTAEWNENVIESIAATASVRILDLKGHYAGTDVDQEPNPGLYRLVLNGFPDAVVEDPGITDDTRSLFEGEEHRISWDAPITGVEAVENLPFEPEWLNVKPSRFGTVESLFETIEYARENDITLYGGGQFELGVGRQHIQLLASLFYPDGPNDVAPGGYNDPEIPEGLPTSPLDAPENEIGLKWT
ncbi:hypothetical protein [Halopelagius longus]|uniref:L-alanine-DL-glutamate epimerase n=1 Tax=Halopelagius longus TaxID=1236180 RepID=A0A1H0Y9F2_9EURY|nr:hypothetical protein [Halopelagius longus]RDI72356.1 hypothetical protein DWB78_11880 [Halopelagius longus]SDQ11693.1 hypothetical protein SAMN05216278_0487 [Halopelagius longus]